MEMDMSIDKKRRRHVTGIAFVHLTHVISSHAPITTTTTTEKITCSKTSPIIQNASISSTEPLLRPISLNNDLALDVPLILAPMAGVTTRSFRSICRAHGASLTISEMLHANLFVSSEIPAPSFGDSEGIRSVQLYGTEANSLSIATKKLIEEHGTKHIDLNFGCPAPKVIKKQGGAYIPTDCKKLYEIVSSVVKSANGVAVTAKMRLGLTNDQLTFLNAGRIIEEAGACAVTVHARTAEQRYEHLGARKNWSCLQQLKQHVRHIHVFGNGDLFTAQDAVDMVRLTGVDGVVIGRGALGRPWLFADLYKAFGCSPQRQMMSDKDSNTQTTVPDFVHVRQIMINHLEEEVQDWLNRGKSELEALRSVRKWVGYYFQGYDVPKWWTSKVMKAEALDEWREALLEFDGQDVTLDLNLIIAARGKK